MPLIKLNNRSIKDVTSFPFGVGNLIHIQSQTASNSASISFTTGINSTYKEYQFYFINVRPVDNARYFEFNLSTDSGSNYNVTKTSTTFASYHAEDDSFTGLTYETGTDLAQSTGYQKISYDQSNESYLAFSGSMSLFNPSSTTYVKHFISNTNSGSGAYSSNLYSAGYGNTTSAINAIVFRYNVGNISDGTIALFGVV